MDVHLHLLIHGMSGNPVHMNEAVKLFEARHPTVELFVPASISNRNTYDGIDWNAERVLNEVCCCAHVKICSHLHSWTNEYNPSKPKADTLPDSQ